MYDIAIKTRIGSDGILRLEVPTTLVDTDVDVTLSFCPAGEVRRASRRINIVSTDEEVTISEYLNEAHRHSIYDT